MLVDTTAFDWTQAASDAGLLLLGVLICIACATHAGASFSDAGPAARAMLWRRAQLALGFSAETPRDADSPVLNF